MRKILLAAVVATALFAVGAFAASFAVESEDIASGSDPVTACAESVEIDFGAASVSSGGVWTVNNATATFSGGPGCVGFQAQLAIVAGGPSAVVSVPVTVAAGNTASFVFNPTTVTSIVGASVMVDGLDLADTTL